MDRDAKFKIYQEVAKQYGIDLKGKKMAYTSLNGNMYSFLSAEGELAFRMGKKDLNEFIEKHNSRQSVQYGAVMKEYAVIPESLTEVKKLAPYFATCLEYAKTLKPKPTTKKKA